MNFRRIFISGLLTVFGAAASKASLKEVEALLDGIAREAVGLKK